ncbi:tRNA lysidine(34) synthetase TilS [Mobilicoccus pelagius]|uniref:tRNA(Ile)-lysidine synthase n=1 Tax=Mobilicoccus pelagius NBRC 104925 TaxID=1089455 RepID=H5US80_9MICO|nr:tRNA lysidine(34) synthetase TilS [Mobilicoccus pelagius]GAB48588.1 tRNA(Ile)-lysidine synthase [Mobilicoccus pelagius NBRC 104925]
MPGPHPAVAATRRAVRRVLEEIPSPRHVLAAVSGGADSLALAAALAFECDPRRPAVVRAGDVRAGAVVVDHGLQEDSAAVAASAAATCRDLGLDAEVVRVEVAPAGEGGPEARAREARHAALEDARLRVGADVILLGHTRDDQAEQVLLGLVRGSGTRSLAGMPPRRGHLRRPFLDLDRATTRAACEAAGLLPWDDPHNDDPRYLRVRARALLARVEDDLPGTSAALARSADLLRDDADALDALADDLLAHVGGTSCPVGLVADRPAALRRRVWRGLAVAAGVPAGDLRAGHLAAIDALAVDWHGQGPVDLPGGTRAVRLASPPRIRIGYSPPPRVR